VASEPNNVGSGQGSPTTKVHKDAQESYIFSGRFFLLHLSLFEICANYLIHWIFNSNLLPPCAPFLVTTAAAPDPARPLPAPRRTPRAAAARAPRRVLLLLSASCRVLLRVRGRGCLRLLPCGAPCAAVGPRLLAAAAGVLQLAAACCCGPPAAARCRRRAMGALGRRCALLPRHGRRRLPPSPAAVPWLPRDAAFDRLRAAAP